MATTPSVGTCMAFSAAAPATLNAAGFAALTWTGAAELREIGELGGEREVSTNTNLCSGVKEKSLGAIDNGDQEITLAFDIDEPGQVVLTNAFKANTVISCRETLTSGDVFYYQAMVSKSKVSVVDGDEIKWMGSFAITGQLVEVAA